MVSKILDQVYEGLKQSINISLKKILLSPSFTQLLKEQLTKIKQNLVQQITESIKLFSEKTLS